MFKMFKLILESCCGIVGTSLFTGRTLGGKNMKLNKKEVELQMLTEREVRHLDQERSLLLPVVTAKVKT